MLDDELVSRNFAQLSKKLVAAVDRMEKGGIAAHAKDPMGMAALFLTNQSPRGNR
jgi:hypothetical protein